MSKLEISNYTFFIVLFFYTRACAVTYDDSVTTECLSMPLKPHYGGGIVTNPEVDQGLNGWTTFGDSKIEHGVSHDGNKYIVASNRKQSFHSFTQRFKLEDEKIYSFSAWLRVSHGEAKVAAMFKTKTGFETAGWVTAQEGCWSMLKGGLVVDTSGPAHLYFETNNTDADIWADSISLQPFSRTEWSAHQQQRTEKVRKTKVQFHAADEQGRPIPNATVSLTQSRSSFPFGCAINHNILNNPQYQQWFSSAKFTHTVFENEVKWYSTERSQGNVDYSTSDKLLTFAQSNGLKIRGHNIFWDDPSQQPGWVKGLSSNALLEAANSRINSVVSKYRGKFIHWDVMNENMHFNFFEMNLRNPAASSIFYQTSHKIDGQATPFLNEYNTIENSGDPQSSPDKYLQKIRDLRSQGYNGPLGIGLEGHFTYGPPNLAYVRASIETLASTKLPIWVTELDVASGGPNQASYLEQILQELFSNEHVQGVIIWAAWSPQGCYRMCLTDNNFMDLDTGTVIKKFVNGLTHTDDLLNGSTDYNGVYETSLYHGEYKAKISHPDGQVYEFEQINVVPEEEKMTHIYRFTINGNN